MPQSLIRGIRVEDLFGKFSHQIPEQGSLGSPAILYGDNGVGKTTVLNIVFHLLSAADNRGHRTALRNIPFRAVSVELSENVEITAVRTGEIDSPILILKIIKEGKALSEWHFGPEKVSHFMLEDNVILDSHSNEFASYYRLLDEQIRGSSRRAIRKVKSDGVARGQHEYMAQLAALVPNMFYLNADRKLDSDSVSETTDSGDIRRLISTRELKTANDILRASRGLSLDQALDNAARWVNRRAVSGANRGSENTHSAYETILSQISMNYNPSMISKDQPSAVRISELIDLIANDTLAFSKYELAAELKMEKFKKVLSSDNPEMSNIAYRVIEPYVNGLVTHINAVRPIYDIVDNFVSTINDFLFGKTINFSLSQGFHIKDDNGDSLRSDQLSSGEQQVLLIFSHVLAAREHPSVFIIDEPEISLNIKWQRKIVNALLSVAEGSEIQFIFASHSLELIAQHSDSVVEIKR